MTPILRPGRRRLQDKARRRGFGLAAGAVVVIALLVASGASCPDPTLPNIHLGPTDAGVEEVRMLEPPDGMTGVPTNLRRALVAFDEAVTGATSAGALGLYRIDTGATLPSSVQAADGSCPGAAPGACYAIVPTAVLPVQVTVRLAVDAGSIELASGEAFPPPTRTLPAFETGSGPRSAPPLLLAVTDSAADQCLEVSLETDEPVLCTLSLTDDSGITSDLAAESGYTLQHDLLVAMPPWPPLALVGDGDLPDASTCVVGAPDAGTQGASYAVRCDDLAGNEGTSGPRPLPAHAPDRLVINEVLSHAIGGADAQFVELYNAGQAVAQLSGYTLGSETGASVLPSLVVPPGTYVLVVGQAYAPGCGDAQPDPTALVAHVEGRLMGGLSKDAGTVALIDADGAVASLYPGNVDTSSAMFSGCSIERIDAQACGAPDDFAVNDEGSATPGYKNSVSP
jgi:hypothetical protein